MGNSYNVKQRALQVVETPTAALVIDKYYYLNDWKQRTRNTYGSKAKLLSFEEISSIQEEANLGSLPFGWTMGVEPETGKTYYKYNRPSGISHITTKNPTGRNPTHVKVHVAGEEIMFRR